MSVFGVFKRVTPLLTASSDLDTEGQLGRDLTPQAGPRGKVVLSVGRLEIVAIEWTHRHRLRFLPNERASLFAVPGDEGTTRAISQAKVRHGVSTSSRARTQQACQHD